MPWTEITRDQYRREGLRYLRPGDGPFGGFWLKRDGLLASRRAFSRSTLSILRLGSAISPARRSGLPARIGCAARRMRD